MEDAAGPCRFVVVTPDERAGIIRAKRGVCALSQQRRPILQVPRSRAETVFELVTLGGITASILFVASYWTTLPDTIPSHYALSGEPDAWSGKGILLLFPLLNLSLYAMITLFSRYPHGFNYPWPITEQNAARQYLLARACLGWLKMIVVLNFAFIEWKTILTALGKMNGLGFGQLPLMFLFLFAGLGFYYHRMHQAR